LTEVIYLDYNSTTPVDPRVVEVMLPFFTTRFGNAASSHLVGRAARTAVEDARAEVASAIGAPPSFVTFTSGATESINLALKGLAQGAGRRRRVVTVGTEHKAVLDTVRALHTLIEVSVVGVDHRGVVDIDELADTIGDDTLVVSVMAANNETGVLNPIRDVANLAHEKGALMHCDATQAFGKVPFDFLRLDLDLVSISAHKIYGPQGVGGLIATPEASGLMTPLFHGGGHERGLRSGTLNVPGCVGFGAAARVAAAQLADDAERIGNLRDRLELSLCAIPGVTVNGQGANRLPGTANLRFPRVTADAMMLAMPEVAVSSGSACTASSLSPSHVLMAMGLSYEEADECLRFSLGRPTTEEEIEGAIKATTAAVQASHEIGAYRTVG
jgi:cysteine desulfurase